MSRLINPSTNSGLAFLLGAALVGGAFGFTADRLVTRDRVCPRWGDEQAMRHVFFQELSLSSNQQGAVENILDAKRQAIRELVQPVRPGLDSIADLANQRIREVLDPQQRVTFEQMVAQIKAQKAAQAGSTAVATKKSLLELKPEPVHD